MTQAFTNAGSGSLSGNVTSFDGRSVCRLQLPGSHRRSSSAASLKVRCSATSRLKTTGDRLSSQTQTTTTVASVTTVTSPALSTITTSCARWCRSWAARAGWRMTGRCSMRWVAARWDTSSFRTARIRAAAIAASGCLAIRRAPASNTSSHRTGRYPGGVSLSALRRGPECVAFRLANPGGGDDDVHQRQPVQPEPEHVVRLPHRQDRARLHAVGDRSRCLRGGDAGQGWACRDR